MGYSASSNKDESSGAQNSAVHVGSFHRRWAHGVREKRGSEVFAPTELRQTHPIGCRPPGALTR